MGKTVFFIVCRQVQKEQTTFNRKAVDSEETIGCSALSTKSNRNTKFNGVRKNWRSGKGGGSKARGQFYSGILVAES